MIYFAIASIAFALACILDTVYSLGKGELVPLFRDRDKIFSPWRYVLFCAVLYAGYYYLGSHYQRWGTAAATMIPAIAVRAAVVIFWSHRIPKARRAR